MAASSIYLQVQDTRRHFQERRRKSLSSTFFQPNTLNTQLPILKRSRSSGGYITQSLWEQTQSSQSESLVLNALVADPSSSLDPWSPGVVNSSSDLGSACSSPSYLPLDEIAAPFNSWGLSTSEAFHSSAFGMELCSPGTSPRVATKLSLSVDVGRGSTADLTPSTCCGSDTFDDRGPDALPCGSNALNLSNLLFPSQNASVVVLQRLVPETWPATDSWEMLGAARSLESQAGPQQSPMSLYNSTASPFPASFQAASPTTRLPTLLTNRSGKLKPVVKKLAAPQPLVEDEATVSIHRDKTTLMIRNLPAHVTQPCLIEELNQSGFQGSYDFLYVPLYFETNLNKGFAFVNFIDPCKAAALVGQWHLQQPFVAKQDVQGRHALQLNIAPAHIQGLEANLQKWMTPRLRRIKNPNLRPFVLEKGKHLLPLL